MQQIKTLGYIITNIATSIGIVLTNKWVFTTQKFNCSTTLTVIHFATTFLVLEILAYFKVFKKVYIPFHHVLKLSLSFSLFVILTNLSLRLNSVGFYQTAKVLTTPTVVLIQTTFFKTTFTKETKSSLLLTCFGVLIVSLTDFQLNVIGTLCALLGVLAGSIYQIWVGSKQKELGLNSFQLLWHQSFWSFLVLGFFVPFLDDWEELVGWRGEGVAWVGVSAGLAVGVNLSTFLVIGSTSAITYNMCGHLKLSLILFFGFLLFNTEIDGRQIAGIGFTLIGITWYSKIKLNENKTKSI